MKTKLFLSTFFLLVFAENLLAQDKLPEDQQVEFQNYIKQMVEDFQIYLCKIGNKEYRHEVRKEYVKKLFSLFIGEGDLYDYYDDETDRRIHNTGVKIQFSSADRAQIKSQKLKSYIYKLYNPETGESALPYTKISIGAVDIMRIDNIEKIGDHYECVAYFYQKYDDYIDGRIGYTDNTIKKIRCYITNIDSPAGKKVWGAKLGDIYVLNTEKVK